MITRVKLEHVPSVWPYVRGHISRACEHSDGTLTAPDVLVKLLKDEMQLWIIRDKAAAVTQIVRYSQSLTVRIVSIGGAGMREWLKPFLETVEAWAKSIGADRMEASGREGWSRVSDYKVIAQVIAKRL